MALTNDQITAQNFKDFYGQIRPYLNGQVPTFANQFSRSDLYSTDEKIIGQWIDGKPLYQRTFSATLNQTTDGTKVSTKIVASYSALSIDMVYDSDVIIVKPTGNDSYTRWACDRWGDSSQWIFNKLSRSDDFIVETNKESLGGLTCYATLRYTKTGDSAIKVGTGTDYSTDEQIIGTWIDGKPLYQKTVELTNVSLPEAQQITNVTLLSNTTYNYIDSNGIIVSSSGNADTLPLTNFDRTKGSIYYGARVRQQKQTQDKDIVLTLVNYNGSADTYTVSVTIRYTKTTDV